MTLICASIALHDIAESQEAIDRAIDAARAGANLVEWRVDAIADEPDGLTAIQSLARRSPLPCIVTCRLASEGGEYQGDEQGRISLFEALAAAGDVHARPRYIDVELAAFGSSANLRQKVLLAVDHQQQPRDLETRLILSAHDFQGRPADLLQRVEAMTNQPACAVMKVAWHARSLRDNLEAFELLAARRKPMIALCMGPFGLMSRVLAPKFGGFLTYAIDQAEQLTAPGQPTIELLRATYRFDSITPATKVYGVIGWPVEQSKGPLIHNAGFAALGGVGGIGGVGGGGFDAVYLPLPVPPEYEHFKATVGAMVDFAPLHFRGASVTLPHKENLVRFVRERGGAVDPLAARIGAANTLLIDERGGLSCLNTDAQACIDALCAGMGIDRAALASRRVAILGAGGMARAAAAALADCGAQAFIFSRNPERAARLAADLTATIHPEGPGRISAGEERGLSCGCFHVFINCTPLGMAGGPGPDESPLPDDVHLDDSVTVFDTVYNPVRTPLVREAAARGARIITGLDLFIRQAAMQFERWTGKPAPMDVFRKMLETGAAP